MTPVYKKIESGNLGGGAVVDLNTITKSGIYYTVGGNSSNTPNNNIGWEIIHTQDGSTNNLATQIAYSGGGSDYQKRRTKNTTWSQWENIKLGTSATRDVGTTAGTVAAGNDARFPA